MKYPLGNKGLLLSVPEMVKFSELLGRSTSKRIKCIVMTFHTIKDQTEGVCVPSCMTSVGETLAEKQRPAFICARDDNEIFRIFRLFDIEKTFVIPKLLKVSP